MITLTTRQKLFIARQLQSLTIAGFRLIGKGYDVEIMRRGVRWRLDLREGIDFSIWLLGAFEPRTLRQYERLIKPGDVALDVGANIGAHTLHLARAVGPSGRVIAFEPTDYAFGKLRVNLSLNPTLATRVDANQMMLMERSAPDEAPAVYSSWPLAPGAKAVHPLHGGALQACSGAKIVSLDDFVQRNRLERIDLLKLDIDGFECPMLRGAADTLARLRPVIVMEFAPYVLGERGGSVRELVEILGAAKYGLQDVDTGKSLPMDTAKLESLIPWGGGRNILARPN